MSHPSLEKVKGTQKENQGGERLLIIEFESLLLRKLLHSKAWWCSSISWDKGIPQRSWEERQGKKFWKLEFTLLAR